MEKTAFWFYTEKIQARMAELRTDWLDQPFSTKSRAYPEMGQTESAQLSLQYYPIFRAYLVMRTLYRLHDDSST